MQLAHTMVCVPRSRMDILSEAEIDAVAGKPKLVTRYKLTDSQRVFEILTQRQEKAAKKTAAATANQKDKKGSKTSRFFDNPVVKQAERTAASVITHSLLGALGLDGRPGRAGRKRLF